MSPALTTSRDEFYLIIQCAWCQTVLGTKPCDEQHCGQVTHTICPACKRQYDSPLPRMDWINRIMIVWGQSQPDPVQTRKELMEMSDVELRREYADKVQSL